MYMYSSIYTIFTIVTYQLTYTFNHTAGHIMSARNVFHGEKRP